MLAYFETMGVLLALYCLVRWLVWTELRLPKCETPPGKSDEAPATALDASALRERVQHVRHDYLAELPTRPQAFKQPLLVESKRAQVAKQAFFHRPPEPGPDEREDGLTVMMV